MESNVTQIESDIIKGSKLNLIVDSKTFLLNGPWHFDDDQLQDSKVNLNELSLNFNCLLNLEGCNYLIHPEDHDAFKNLIGKLALGKSVDYHFRIITPKAEVKQIHGYGTLQSLEMLEARITHDFEIAKQLEASDPSEKQRNSLQQILDTIPQMVWISNAKGEINFFNDAWYSYTGLSPEQCADFDHESTDIFHPSQGPDVRLKWQECIRNGSPYSGETLVKNLQGNYRWHIDMALPVKDGSGKIEMWIGIFTDVHEQFSNERKVKENGDLLDAVCNSSLNSIQILDSVYSKSHQIVDFKWKYCNKPMLPASGKIDLVGKRLVQTYPGMKANGVFEKIKRVVETGESAAFEQYCNDDGLNHWFHTVAVKLEDGVVLTHHDITERREITAEVDKLKAMLHQRNYTQKILKEELSTFAFIACHDLCEPLRKIQVFSQTLIDNEKDKLSDKGKEYFNRMISAARRMADLVHDIQIFSSASACAVELQEIDLNQLTKTVLVELTPEIETRHAIIECAPLPVVKGYPMQFSQLIQNLISNALKFQQDGIIPHIQIRCAFLAGHEIDNPGVLPHHRYVKLDVMDNGIGFDPKYASKIFQMFQRLHTPSEFPGTGMGLAICKKVVENHQGFIVADSKPGEGSVFACYFPVLT